MDEIKSKNEDQKNIHFSNKTSLISFDNFISESHSDTSIVSQESSPVYSQSQSAPQKTVELFEKPK